MMEASRRWEGEEGGGDDLPHTRWRGQRRSHGKLVDRTRRWHQGAGDCGDRRGPSLARKGEEGAGIARRWWVRQGDSAREREVAARVSRQRQVRVGVERRPWRAAGSGVGKQVGVVGGDGGDTARTPHMQWWGGVDGNRDSTVYNTSKNTSSTR